MTPRKVSTTCPPPQVGWWTLLDDHAIRPIRGLWGPWDPDSYGFSAWIFVERTLPSECVQCLRDLHLQPFVFPLLLGFQQEIGLGNIFPGGLRLALEPGMQRIFVDAALTPRFSLLPGFLLPIAGELPPIVGMLPVIHQRFGKELIADFHHVIDTDVRRLDGQEAGIAGLSTQVGPIALRVDGDDKDGAPLARDWGVGKFRDIVIAFHGDERFETRFFGFAVTGKLGKLGEPGSL